ncbi:hypothetical protein GCM10009084_04310 [Marinomonas primoryensis]
MPIVIPNVMANVMHIPGVIDTKKNVGINAERSARFTKKSLLK